VFVLEHLYQTKVRRKPEDEEENCATGPGRRVKPVMNKELNFVAFFV